MIINSPEKSAVIVYDCGRADYPRRAPFHPPASYAEYPFSNTALEPDNYVYASVRSLFHLWGLDSAHYNTVHWNPLGELIQPGDNVVIKPNLVISEHELGEIGLLASVAHGSILRPLVDYALIANKGEGTITICDCPIKEVEFDKVAAFSGLMAIKEFYETMGKTELSVIDLRDLWAERFKDGRLVRSGRLSGDPQGYTIIDLAERSMLAEVAQYSLRFRSTAAVYGNAMAESHTPRLNLYSISNTVLRADVFISVSKLKVHRKSGVTLSLKNMFGITNEKRWLPHHRVGTPAVGGDTCPDNAPIDHRVKESLIDLFASHRSGQLGFRYLWPLFRMGNRVLGRRLLSQQSSTQKVADIGEGNWYGNDTVWRTVLDLNMILLYADKQGVMQQTRQRRYLSVVDGILGGDREGPLRPRPRDCGLLIAGQDPYAVDIVCCRLMGFDPVRIPIMNQWNRTPWLIGVGDPARITVISNAERWREWSSPNLEHLGFEAPSGWRGHIELNEHNR